MSGGRGWRATRQAFFALPLVLLTLLFVYDLAAAVLAPVCRSVAELDGWWCVTIGWEGPFADFWSNRSRSNAIINATLNLSGALAAFVICIWQVARGEDRANLVIVLTQLALVAALVLKGLALNEVS